MTSTLSPEEAQRHYEANAAKQDSQAWYEDEAFRVLIACADFGGAREILEVGCGTGRLAEILLRDQLPSDARYTGIDIAPAMLARAAKRLSPFAPQVTLKPGDVTLGLTAGTATLDRVVATYLFDLLSPAHSKNLISEFHRVLKPDGLMCLASMTPQTSDGDTTILTQIWRLVQKRWPWLVGGCRPVELHALLDDKTWKVMANETVSPKGVISQILIARKIDPHTTDRDSRQ
ncbi:MAG: class I SAM-dependent methyltransferase [Hyphomicrobiaceae bacterium]|nr:class I SAM-dependent methyltransferase [Hyphomicrobiaceae bacterium]